MAEQARPWSSLAEREPVEQVLTGQARAPAHSPSLSSAQWWRAQAPSSAAQMPVQPRAARRMQLAPSRTRPGPAEPRKPRSRTSSRQSGAGRKRETQKLTSASSSFPPARAALVDGNNEVTSTFRHAFQRPTGDQRAAFHERVGVSARHLMLSSFAMKISGLASTVMFAGILCACDHPAPAPVTPEAPKAQPVADAPVEPPVQATPLASADAATPNPPPPRGKRAPCTTDQSCNRDPSVSALWGHCVKETGVCECKAGFELHPGGSCQPIAK